MYRSRMSRRPIIARSQVVSKRASLDILVISRCPAWPLSLGDRLILYYVARELSSRGHNLHLLAFFQQPRDLADVPFYSRFFRTTRLLPESKRSAWQYLLRRYQSWRRFPTQAWLCWSGEMWRAINDRVRAAHYDVVYLFGGVSVYEYYRLVRPIPNVMAAYESHSLFLERAARNARGLVERLVNRLLLSMARNYESWMYSGFDRVVVLSDQDADALRTLDPSMRLAVIPNGVDVDHFASTVDDHEVPMILFTGNFSYPPNADAAQVLAREVLPLVRQQVPNVRLMLVGADPPPSLLALQCEYITVTGRVPDMRCYFDQASVYVSPLRVGAGIKNKVLEAMAMSKAVVATPLSCDGIDVISGQNVVLADTPATLAEQVVRVLTDPELRRRVARGGHQLVQSRYTWRHVAERYEALFRQVIQERQQAGG